MTWAELALGTCFDGIPSLLYSIARAPNTDSPTTAVPFQAEKSRPAPMPLCATHSPHHRRPNTRIHLSTVLRTPAITSPPPPKPGSLCAAVAQPACRIFFFVTLAFGTNRLLSKHLCNSQSGKPYSQRDFKSTPLRRHHYAMYCGAHDKVLSVLNVMESCP
mmetsp:Transcript_85657/g.143023  ORF Transcript_85657/g.143023 Transcript_85657/m.143023 type:complete len:161 (+) Transcript_85657:2-484(+)